MRGALAKITDHVNWSALATVWALLLITVAGLVVTGAPDVVVATILLLVIAMAAGAAVTHRTLAEIAQRSGAGDSAGIRLETREAHRSRGSEAAGELAALPAWVLALLGPDKGPRYAAEWRAHLHHRIDRRRDS